MSSCCVLFMLFSEVDEDLLQQQAQYILNGFSLGAGSCTVGLRRLRRGSSRTCQVICEQ